MLTPHLKLKHWGPGEWVDEPDLFEFYHLGYWCVGKRMAFWEGPDNEYLSGGYWCGYVVIPHSHSWYGKDYSQLQAHVHGGLSFGEEDPCTETWILGFDCAHPMDIVPSCEKFLKERGLNDSELEKKYPNMGLWEKTYKNMEFVKQECRNLAEQASKEKHHD